MRLGIHPLKGKSTPQYRCPGSTFKLIYCSNAEACWKLLSRARISMGSPLSGGKGLNWFRIHTAGNVFLFGATVELLRSFQRRALWKRCGWAVGWRFRRSKRPLKDMGHTWAGPVQSPSSATYAHFPVSEKDQRSSSSLDLSRCSVALHASIAVRSEWK